MAKSNIKRIRRLEDVAMGAGLLLQKLRHTYGSDFGVGMTEQVDHCILDIKQIERARLDREAREASQGVAKP